MKSTITRKPVQSSNIKSVGYHPETRTLSVEFKSGGIYHYHDVPGSVHQDLGNAESVGAFMDTKIKGRFHHSKHS